MGAALWTPEKSAFFNLVRLNALKDDPPAARARTIAVAVALDVGQR